VRDFQPDLALKLRLGTRSPKLCLAWISACETELPAPGSQAELGNQREPVLAAVRRAAIAQVALFNLQERGRMLVSPGDEVYEGQVVGIHSRDNDLVVNPLKAKQLTNIRAAGSDENILLTPPIRFSLEQALEFIEGDELVEVTPGGIRIRKRFLKEQERKRAGRG
jgi:GTP-binding protein